MKNKKQTLLLLAGLLLTVLLALLLALRNAGRYREAPPVQVPAEVMPPPPEAAPLKPARPRALPAEKPKEKVRKLRVSSLRDPGEAMGGGVRLDLPDKTTEQPKTK